jgi:hypothetical protein
MVWVCAGTFDFVCRPTRMSRLLRFCSVAIALVPSAWADDPAARELQRSQLQRQQQQDELQLRMQQYQRNAPSSGSLHPDQGVRQLEIEQLQRQRELHYRQNQNVAPPAPMDDEGTRRAKAQIEQQRAQQESRRQMQHFDWEMEQARRRNSTQ